MSFDIVPFHVNHIELMQIQPAQKHELVGAMGEPFGTAWTAVADGLPVAAAGLIGLWPLRHCAWALIGADAGPWFVRIHRAVLGALARTHGRIEMSVDAEFQEGRRWAEMLGFHLETPEPMAAYFPDGRSGYLYARVNHVRV